MELAVHAAIEALQQADRAAFDPKQLGLDYTASPVDSRGGVFLAQGLGSDAFEGLAQLLWVSGAKSLGDDARPAGLAGARASKESLGLFTMEAE